MKINFRHLSMLFAISVAALATPHIAIAAPKSPSTSVIWTGNGTTLDGQSRSLTTVLCSPTIGATAEGNYLLFVLASTKGFTTTPTIKIGTSVAVPMTKSNSGKPGTSSFRYILNSSTQLNLQSLLESGVVASNFGSAAPTLTLSHGCNQSTAMSCGDDPFTAFTANRTDISDLPDEFAKLVSPIYISNSTTTTLSSFFNSVIGAAGMNYLASIGCVTFTASFGPYVSDSATNVIFTQNLITTAANGANSTPTNWFINPTFFSASYPGFLTPIGNFVYPGPTYPDLRVNCLCSSADSDARAIVYTLKFFAFDNQTGPVTSYTFSYPVG